MDGCSDHPEDVFKLNHDPFHLSIFVKFMVTVIVRDQEKRLGSNTDFEVIMHQARMIPPLFRLHLYRNGNKNTECIDSYPSAVYISNETRKNPHMPLCYGVIVDCLHAVIDLMFLYLSTVDKASHMMGSYGPKAEEHVFISPASEAPKGLMACGQYVVKSHLLDDDKNIHLSWEWNLAIKKDWD